MFCLICNTSLASNSDYTFCNSGHFICMTCSPSSNEKCIKCGNKMQKMSEEIGAIIFEKNEIVSNFELNLSEMYPYLESESNSVNQLTEDDLMDYISEHQSNKKKIRQMKFFSEHNAEYVKENTLDFSKQIAGSTENFKSCLLGRVPSESVCRFKIPSDEDFGKYSPEPTDDPKKNYLRTISGEAIERFEPMEDYFERIAKVNELHDYQNRTNLYIAVKIQNGEEQGRDDLELKSKESCRNYLNVGSNDTEGSVHSHNPNGSIASDMKSGTIENTTDTKIEFGSEENSFIKPKSRFYASELLNDANLKEMINQEIENSLNKMFESNVGAVGIGQEYEQQHRNSLREKLREEIYSQFKSRKEPTVKNEHHEYTSMACKTTTDARKYEEIQDNCNKSSYKNKNLDTFKRLEPKSVAISTESYPKLKSKMTSIPITKNNNKQHEILRNQKDNESFVEQFSTYDSELRVRVDHNQNKLLKNENFTFIPKEMQANLLKSELVPQTVYYVFPTYPDSLPTKELQFNALTEPEYTADQMKKIAENLVKDFREEPLQNREGPIDIDKFIKFLREKFPNITLKNLKDIVENLSHNYTKSDHPRPMYNETPLSSQENPTTPMQIPSIYAMRAYFCRNHRDTPNSEPLPKFELVHPFDLSMEYITIPEPESRPAINLNIPRSPVLCPVTSCSKLIFVSEFAKHIKVDHVKMPIETISPGKHKNLFLDPRANRCGYNKSHILYLVSNKISDLGSREYKDYLPILLMSTKVNSIEFLCPGIQPSCEDDQSLVIWLTGLKPIDLPIFYSLTAWSSKGPGSHVVHSGSLYSIRNSQDCRSLFDSGEMLLLSQKQCESLSNNGRNMIELQIIVH